VHPPLIWKAHAPELDIVPDDVDAILADMVRAADGGGYSLEALETETASGPETPASADNDITSLTWSSLSRGGQ
jgi:hypothetical protein